MLFNSIEFLFFLPTVFLLYWFVFVKSLKLQNLLILLSSYTFYGWWDYRFLVLIFLSTVVDFILGILILDQNNRKIQKLLVLFSILFNLGLLGFFKYFNFFIDSWVDLLSSIGFEVKSQFTLNIILPVGISFYTFQTMSYTIDIFRKKLVPTRDFLAFASFVSFFPQLVAGPIERAKNLLPQILTKREFRYDHGIQGLRLIIWGLSKKIVIADSLAPIVDNIFNNFESFGGGTLWLGAIFFAFQIYCDFSGYSDIAIGTSKLFGFELMSNFKFPYFSRNIGEFWRRWHISLSSWFRDYVYIPLGGSRNGTVNSFKNIFITFIVSGFWHGANWTFIAWGVYHSILYVPTYFLKTNRKYLDTVIGENSFFPSIKEMIEVFLTFIFVTIGWVIFRAETLSDSFKYLKIMFLDFQIPNSNLRGMYFITPLLFLDYLFRKKEKLDFKISVSLELLISLILIFIIIGSFNNSSSFIYFQF